MPRIQRVWQTYERVSKENNLDSPGGGRINGLHSDMFAVGIIGTKVFGDLQFLSMDGGLDQSDSYVPTCAGGSDNTQPSTSIPRLPRVFLVCSRWFSRIILWWRSPVVLSVANVKTTNEAW